MSSAGTRRLYFALWPTAQQGKTLLDATRAELESCGGRPVPRDKLHITLCFLGSVAAQRVAALIDVGSRAAAGCDQALELSLDRVLRWRTPQVLCALCGRDVAPGQAHALAGRLRRLAQAAGFEPDEKPFRPHVTLARKVTRNVRPRSLPHLTWRFSRFALVESRTLDEGPQYSIVEQFELDKAGP